MVSIRVIGEDNAVAFAGGQAAVEFDVMTLVTSLRPGVGLRQGVLRDHRSERNGRP